MAIPSISTQELVLFPLLSLLWASLHCSHRAPSGEWDCNGARVCVIKGPQEEYRMEKVAGTMQGGCQLDLHLGGREGNSLGQSSKWNIGYGEYILILVLNEK